MVAVLICKEDIDGVIDLLIIINDNHPVNEKIIAGFKIYFFSNAINFNLIFIYFYGEKSPLIPSSKKSKKNASRVFV